MTNNSPYAWIIDRDHLADDFGDEKGVIGPRGANVGPDYGTFEENKAELSRNYQHHHQFRMYDDDGELYYTGTLYWNGYANYPENEEIDFAYSPLDDFGMPNAGAVLIKYTGKPQWDCG